MYQINPKPHAESKMIIHDDLAALLQAVIQGPRTFHT